MRTAKTLIRLGGCPDWSESSLGAHSFCSDERTFLIIENHVVKIVDAQPSRRKQQQQEACQSKMEPRRRERRKNGELSSRWMDPSILRRLLSVRDFFYICWLVRKVVTFVLFWFWHQHLECMLKYDLSIKMKLHGPFWEFFQAYL